MSKEVQSSVRDIVSQIKNGEKNRPDAFQELREVLLQSRARTNSAPSGAVKPEEESRANVTGGDISEVGRFGGVPVTSAVTPTQTTQFTRESRHAIISQIIEKKKQQRQMMKNNAPDPESANHYIDLRASADSEATRVSSAFSVSQNEQSTMDAEGVHLSSSFVSPAIKQRRPSTGSVGRPQSAGRAQSGPRTRSRSSGPSLDRQGGGGGGRSVDDLQLSTKDLRTLQYEARIRNDLFKECTFHPKVKRLPSAYGSMKDSDTPFLARVQHWQREKEQAAVRKKTALEKNEVSECTFKPQINTVSKKAAKELRRSQSHEAIAERLYRSSEEIAEHKARFLEEERARELEEEAKECTFQPQLVTNSRKFQHVTPRFDRFDPTHKEVPESPSAKECTFTPKIKGVRKNMDSAAMYLSANVVDRLTRPFNSANQHSFASMSMSMDDQQRGLDPDRPVMDVAAFMGSLQYSGGQQQQRPSSAPRERTSSGGAGNKMNFEAFLNRQMQTELRKQKEISETLNSVTPSFTPAINRRSQSLASSISRGEFLERVERDAKRRLHESQKKQMMAQEPHSFQPELSAKAERMRPRSSYELSRGDLLKRETAHRMLKLRLEQEELQKHTYHPELSRLAKSMKSTLQLSDHSDSYIDRVRAASQEKESMRLSILKEREQNETLDCTFRPVTRDCPAYVKRIARSLSIVKSARVTHAAAPAKPEWR